MASTKSPGGVEVGRVHIKILPDTSDFRKELVAQLKKIEKSLRVEIPVDLDMGRVLTDLAKLKAAVEAVDNKINIDTDVKSLGEELGKLSKNADGVSDGFSRMSRAGLIFTAVLVLAAPVIALIGTLIAALPSLLLLAAGGIAAVALGIDGIKNAAKTLTPEVDALRASLANTFETGLVKVFDQLRQVFPALERGLNVVATGLVAMAQGLTDVVTTSLGMELIERILTNIGLFFERLGPAISVGFEAFLKLADAGAAAFGFLNDTLLAFAKSFADMTNSITSDGSFTAALQGLAQVTTSLLVGFNRLIEAGVRVMDELGGPLSSFIDGFIDTLVALMPALSDLSALIFGVLGEALKQLAPIFAALTPAFSELASIVGDILIGVIKELGPPLTLVAQTLGDVLVPVLQALAPIFPPLIAAFGQIAQILGQALAEALLTLSPLLVSLAQFITNLVIALTPLLPPLIQLVDVGLKAILSLLVQLMPLFMRIASEVLPLVTDAVIKMVPGFIEFVNILIRLTEMTLKLAEAVIAFLLPIFEEALNIVESVWPSIEQIIGGAIDVILGIIDFFIDLFTGNWSQLWPDLKRILDGGWNIIVGAIKGGVKAFLDIIFGIPAAILQGLGNLGNLLFGAGKSIVEGLVNGIRDAGRWAKDRVMDVVNSIRNLFPFSPAKEGPFSGHGYTLYSGIALMKDWARGIERGTPAAVAAIDDAMTQSQDALTLNAAVTSDGFGSITDKVAEALSGWSVEIDANGITKLVNRTNRRNERR